MTLPEAHKKFRQYFPGQSFKDYMDPQLSVIARSPIIDLWAFEVFLHHEHGEYEKKGISMGDLLAREYSPAARDFIKGLI